MKKWFLLFTLLAIVKNTFAQFGYKCGSEFISLNPIDSPIRLVKIEDYSTLNKILEQQERYINKTKIENRYCLIDTTLTKGVEPIYESTIYSSKHGYTTLILPEIVISVVNANDLDKLLKQYAGILSLSKEKKDRYVLDCSCNSSEEVLQLVQEIDKIDGVRWCKPGMLSEVRYENNSDNPLFSSQYYLQNTLSNGGVEYSAINAVKAWDIVSGNPNIKVAVIDQGVERDHEDLQGAVLDGYTCNMPNEKGDPINDNFWDGKGHGTSCAGIIAAIDNTTGIKGVASGVKILPINISPDYVTLYFDLITIEFQHLVADPEDIADAIDWAVDNGADVISCSWTHEADTCITNHLNNARIQGRSGKGCVIVASSGNEHDKDEFAGYPANLQGVLCVGAINRNCNIWNYCQIGPAMDLVAPSGDGHSTSDIVTTDRMEDLGYQVDGDWNYYEHFGGTSATCPQVAGVAALLLSLQPDLTESVVRNILCSTAHDLGTIGKDDTFGFGLVDAYAALKVVNSSIIGKTVICDTANYVINDLPSAYTINWNIDNSNFTISPSGNQCFVTYIGTPQYSVANLTATVLWNSTTIKTLTKRIVMHGTDMSATGWQCGDIISPNGIYPDRYFTIPSNNSLLLSKTMPDRSSIDTIFGKESLPIDFIEELSPLDPIVPFDVCGYGITEINGGNEVYLNSTRFDGMDISFSGPNSPIFFDHSGSYVSFKMPYASFDYYTKLLVHSESECHDFCLFFKVVPLPGALYGDDQIWANYVAPVLYIRFENSGEPIGNGQYYLPPFTVTISKIPSGTQVYSNTFSWNQSSFSVNTSGWASGLYSIRIVQGNNVYTKTFHL